MTRTEDRREWRTAKAKDGSDDQGHPFRLEVVELGTDEDGEPITSCAIAPEELAADAMRRALPPKSGNQKVVLEVVRELLKANGLRRPDRLAAGTKEPGRAPRLTRIAAPACCWPQRPGASAPPTGHDFREAPDVRPPLTRRVTRSMRS